MCTIIDSFPEIPNSPGGQTRETRFGSSASGKRNPCVPGGLAKDARLADRRDPRRINALAFAGAAVLVWNAGARLAGFAHRFARAEGLDEPGRISG